MATRPDERANILVRVRRGETTREQAEAWAEQKALRLGDSKTGKSVRPIGRRTIVVLERVMKRNKGPLLFPATRRNGKFQGLPKSWSLVVGRRLPGLTPHGLRHSFASMTEELGFTVPTIGVLLGHAGHGVTSGYIHKVDSALISAANKIADRIAAPMGNVVELARAREA